MRCKIYVSDEGFGPIIRESSIVKEFNRRDKGIDITFQTERHVDEIDRMVERVSVIKRFNNILWSKQRNGSPDISKVKLFFSDYFERSDAFIAKELEEFDYDFIISDFVYEAYHVAAKRDVPSFGIAHFTWDWFFSKMFPSPLPNNVLKRFLDCANAADVLYFPPFTPEEILKHYKQNAKSVPLIVREQRREFRFDKKPGFKVLIMDSGSSVLAPYIQKMLEQISKLKDFCFYASSKFKCESDNIIFLDPKELFSDYIPYMDVVIARAGFNTISECIAYKTPLLLISENVNPEMSENMLMIKKAGLGSMIDIDMIVSNLNDFLPRFVDNEYRELLYNIQNHDIPTNGAKVIVEDILNRIG